MPESETSRSTPYGVGTTLLKRHKILPHPQQRHEPVAVVDSAQEPQTTRQKLSLDTNLTSSPESSSSHTLKHSSKRVGVPSLPLTPPAHSRQSSAGHVSFRSASDSILPPAPEVPPGTPPNQQSPPTPDVTPPKTAWRTAALRPLISDRYPSSRADSFKTAKEVQTPNQSDEDELLKLRPGLQSSQPSSQETVQWAPIYKTNKPIGLGLGLESEEGTETPKPAREFITFDGEWGSGTEDVSEVEREWDDNLMRNVTVRKRPVLESFNDSPCPTGPPHKLFDNREVEPSNAIKQLRRLSLHDRIGSQREDRGMKEKSGIRSISPAVVRDFEMPDTRRFSTLSGRSQTSTVVEAMVVEAPTPRPNGLRRTKKRIALRDVSSSQRSLREQSRSPGHVPQRLVHKNSRIPERRNQSLGSTDTVRTVSTGSSSARSRKEVLESGAIPVVVVPERLSSSKTVQTPSLRSASSRHTRGSKSVSVTSTAPLSSSAKTNDTGYFESKNRHRARTISEFIRVLGNADGEERTFDIEPIVPVRTSSLSATTSRNNSRTGSLTAESLKALNESQAPLLPPMPIAQLQKQPAEVPKTPQQSTSPPIMDHPPTERRKSLDHNGDPFFGNRLSTQVTPFSQISYATSGTAAEVSEALAVPLFPHHNGSLHMIEQQPVNHTSSRAKQVAASKAPKQTEERTLDTVTEAPIMKVNDMPTSGPVTPPQPIRPLSMGDVDSPLRNPRQAPQPPQNQVPSIKFIPPTPASTEDDRQLGHSLDFPQEPMPPAEEIEEKPKRGLSLVRRAWSKRRYSEGFPEGFLVGLGRKFSTKEKADESRPRTSGSEVEIDPLYPAADIPSDISRLHPFWRPARFWEDLENEQQFDDAEGPHEYGRVLYQNGTYPSVDVRPSLPRRKFSLKRTFAILPLKDDDYDYLRSGNETDRRTVRRSPSGNMKVVKKTASNTSLRRSASEHMAQSQRRLQARGLAGGRPATSDGLGASGGRIHTIPGIGVRFEYVGFKGLQARLRERNNKKLKSRISAPRGAWHGEDAVLGNGTAPRPISHVVRNGDGYVVVSRKAKGEKQGRADVAMHGNGGLGEEI